MACNGTLYDNQNDIRRIANKKYFVFKTHIQDKGIEFNEPVWIPRGQSSRNGSLPAAMYLFEALENVQKSLQQKEWRYERQADDLDTYVKS